MAQEQKTNGSKKHPLFDLSWVPDRMDPDAQKKAPWYRCGAIWPTENEDIVQVDFELLNPANGETVRFRLLGRKFTPKPVDQA